MSHNTSPAVSARPLRCLLILYAILALSPTVLLGQGERSPSSRISTADSLVRKGRWRLAIKELDVLIDADADNLHARYLRGIAYREAERGVTLQTNSITDLEYVIRRDSLYADVLLQFAQTLCYRDRHPEDVRRAIELEEAHLRLHGALPSDRFSRFSSHHYLVRNKSPDVALAELRSHPSDLARYFEGEASRRKAVISLLDAESVDETALAEANRRFAQLLDQSRERLLQLPIQAVLLSRARVGYALNDADLAQRLVEEAIASIDSQEAANVIFDDFKFILTEQELQEYRALRSAEDFRSFLARLWVKRDPTPARRINVRLQEHYRRLLRAEELYSFSGIRMPFNEPERYRELELPATHAVATELDDRGLVYLRHGEPAERVRDIGTMNESWHYRVPRMDFHFTVRTSPGPGEPISGVGNQRLTPVPAVPLEDILHWSASYMGLQKDRRLVLDEVISQSRSFVQKGLSTDRHTWADGATALEMPYVIAAFRGENGATQLQVHYAFPAGYRSGAVDVDGLLVEIGLAIHDPEWKPVERLLDIRRLAPRYDLSAAAIGSFCLQVRPDSYHVAVHTLFQGIPLIASGKHSVGIPDFTRRRLMMSDVLSGLDLGPPVQSQAACRETGNMTVNPFNRFSAQQPLRLYFEIYDLSFGADDRTSYEIEYALRPARNPTFIRRLFQRGREVTLSVRTEGKADSRTSVEQTAVDVSQIPPGTYRLIVTVRDKNTKESVQRILQIELTE